MTRVSPMSMACEIFKSTRGQWLTRDELSKLTGVQHWADEFVAQGILNCRLRVKSAGKPGTAAAEYSLAPEWIGPRLAPPQGGSDRASASVGQGTQ